MYGMKKGGPMLHSAIGRSSRTQKCGANEEMSRSARKRSVLLLFILGERLHADDKFSSTEYERVGSNESAERYGREA